MSFWQRGPLMHTFGLAPATLSMKPEINPRAQISWLEVGEVRTRVMIVDNFLQNPDEVRSFALSLGYVAPAGDWYPGLKAHATLDGSSDILEWAAAQMLREVFAHRPQPHYITTTKQRAVCAFSVYALDTSNVPVNFFDQHVDSPYWLATVLHLSLSSSERATAFWQHKPTGLQCWVGSDLIYQHALEQSFGIDLSSPINRALEHAPVFSSDVLYKFIFTRRESRRRLFSPDEDDHWKLIGLVPAEYNRLVVYPTWQIHSVVDTTGLSELTVDNMRLTMNQFVDYPFPERMPRRTVYPVDLYRAVKGLLC